MLSAIRDRRSIYAASAMLAALLVLAGCGSSAAKTPTSGGAPSTATAATTAPAATTSKIPIGTRTGDCGDAKIAVNVVVNAAADVSNDVTSIDADPGCTELILSTTLDRSAGAEAQKLCQAVAPAAFADGFSTVTIRVVGQGHSTAGNMVQAVDGGPCTTV